MSKTTVRYRFAELKKQRESLALSLETIRGSMQVLKQQRDAAAKELKGRYNVEVEDLDSYIIEQTNYMNQLVGSIQDELDNFKPQ